MLYDTFVQAIHTDEIQHYLEKVSLPKPNSHKGQNGKLLVIGGSELFHSSIFWAADVASKIVDMVHFASPANENNQLVRQKIKAGFWSGIVVDWSETEYYIEEDDVVLIGPGMDRSDTTAQITNSLVQKYANKKWVIDGGALQMIDPQLFTSTHIITPHHKELKMVLEKLHSEDLDMAMRMLVQTGVTLLAKGEIDKVVQQQTKIQIAGGNAGLTKGGTGDVLAGLVAGLYCSNTPLVSAVVASSTNKKAGEALWQKVGPYYSAGDLVQQVPQTLWQLTHSNSSK